MCGGWQQPPYLLFVSSSHDSGEADVSIWHAGDIGIVHSIPPDHINAGMNGTEVSVLSSEHVGAEFGLCVTIAKLRRCDGYFIDQAEICILRKKPPPVEKGSWDEIAKFCAWYPQVEGVKN